MMKVIYFQGYTDTKFTGVYEVDTITCMQVRLQMSGFAM